MKSNVKRIFVEKKKGFDIEAQGLFHDLKENLGLDSLSSVRIINRYDLEGISDEEYRAARSTIFSEPPVDIAYDEEFRTDPESRLIAIEYLPGQYDQRADSAAQCIQILSQRERPECRVAKIIVLNGNISGDEYQRAKEYCINPVESHEAVLEKPSTLAVEVKAPGDVAVLKDFIDLSEEGLSLLMGNMGFAMSLEDLAFCRSYFKETEKRNPTVTELRLIDTYWSDHCRHTTFLTGIDNVDIQEGDFTQLYKDVYGSYLKSREFVYDGREKDICLMDLATLAMKELKKRGKLEDLDESDEINACSIVVDADINGEKQEWLVMFKNETHNHPTEIEPFGGAATCLGGAIRDPLSGRVYVYQAMRVTGSGDPRAKVKDTLAGKLPQRKITTGAAAGYSSYGNQIGLATGQVAEIYDEGYIAKRMEIGAVIGAAPKENVYRERPKPGDIIILLGGRTGRDGCGGATGSSKEHNEESLVSCGAEVQKGNPPTERKIQRLFRNPEVSSMIKKCNDFGAGGVSVAIGELADGLEIDLDAVPKKYEGLDGTELAISESQERMAVVVDKENIEAFRSAAAGENLEANVVAVVTEAKRLVMKWRGERIVDISRDFLNTNGVKQNTSVKIFSPYKAENPLNLVPVEAANASSIEEAWLNNIARLNVCSQKGLVERFDSSIGAGTVLMPFGGKYQLSPAEGMAAKLPLLEGNTTTGTLMTFGYNPELAKWSPFHGALYAIVEAVAKIAALGGNYKRVRLTLQEYFEKLGKDPAKWGKPFSALLGAYHAQMALGIPAIGGKDSMSGTFKDMTVPPTLVAFAVDVTDISIVMSTEFKKVGSHVVLVPLKKDENGLPDFNELDRNYNRIYTLIQEGKVLASHSIRTGGVAEAISKMAFGNRIGFCFERKMEDKLLFTPDYGSIVLELPSGLDLAGTFGDVEYIGLGTTIAGEYIEVNGTRLLLEKIIGNWEAPLEGIFPVKTTEDCRLPEKYFFEGRSDQRAKSVPAKPRVFIPVFPGTNCEYDTARAFEKAGAHADLLVVRNLSAADIEHSITEMVKRINQAQIIMLPGGFSGGDEPDGSGKFIATAFRNPFVKEAVTRLLNQRDGLMLGICNGFQALVKLGLLPYGEIRDIDESCPTLTFNTIGRHASCMVYTRIASTKSPWLANVKVDDVHAIPVSHGEGRFMASPSIILEMKEKGQIATQYVDLEGKPTCDIRFNPNGSIEAIEGITSPDGRILGKMGHSERIGDYVAINVPGEKNQKLFEAGVEYFK